MRRSTILPAVLAVLVTAATVAGVASAVSAGATETTSNAVQASSCALPRYPDETCTGVPAGTQLTVVHGDMTIRTPNTVIDGMDIRGCVSVKAPGVVIRRSKVSCPGFEVIASADGDYTGPPLLIEDTEIDCQGTNGTAVGDTNLTARRVDIHGCENGFDLDQNVVVEDSYIHHLYNSPEAHSDGIQLASGHYKIVDGQYVRDDEGRLILVPNADNITIRHNTINAYNTTDHQDGTSAIISNRGSDTNVLIKDNLLSGGAFTLYCDQGATGIGYRVVDNHFSTAYHDTVGAYGPSTECADETQSGNVEHESGAALTLE
jgi:hypothetical protein